MKTQLKKSDGTPFAAIAGATVRQDIILYNSVYVENEDGTGSYQAVPHDLTNEQIEIIVFVDESQEWQGDYLLVEPENGKIEAAITAEVTQAASDEADADILNFDIKITIQNDIENSKIKAGDVIVHRYFFNLIGRKK